MTMDKIRLGIVGCGGMTETHEKAFEFVPDNVVVTGTADVILERAQKAAEILGAEIAVSDYHDLFKYVDAVMLVLPHHLHFEAGMECLKAGKHVLMEKPLCNTEEQCLDLIKYAEEQKLVLMTAYCMRYHPMVVELKSIIDEKRYGDVFQISIWTEQFTKYPEGHWSRSAEKLGGGQLFSHGCHYVDLLLWFLGNPVRGTHMGTNFGTPWMEKEGTSNLTMEFENGALGYHFGTWGARGSKLKYSIHMHCTEGMVDANISEGKLYFHKWETEQPQLLMEYALGKHTQHEISHFADCIRTGSKPLTDGYSSLQGLRVIWKLYEAEKNNVVADLRGLGLDEKSKTSIK